MSGADMALPRGASPVRKPRPSRQTVRGTERHRQSVHQQRHSLGGKSRPRVCRVEVRALRGEGAAVRFGTASLTRRGDQASRPWAWRASGPNAMLRERGAAKLQGDRITGH
jgi:hypothetical protein